MTQKRRFLAYFWVISTTSGCRKWIFIFADDRSYKYGTFAKNRMSISNSYLELEPVIGRFLAFFHRFCSKQVEITHFFDHLTSSKWNLNFSSTQSPKFGNFWRKPHVHIFFPPGVIVTWTDKQTNRQTDKQTDRQTWFY